MTNIFISYRRTDLDITVRIYTWLIEHRVPEEDIFFDQDTKNANQYGSDFPTSIRIAATEAQLMIVVIGPLWTTVQLDGHDKPRIQEDDDWVRQEISIALATKTVILPIRVGDRKAPATDELPADLHPLCSIHMPPLYRDILHFEASMKEIGRTINVKLGGIYPGVLGDSTAKKSAITMAPASYGLFTGREDLLMRLHEAFQKGTDSQRGYVALALSGLGGMGKTQVATKYAHLYGPDGSKEYGQVLWANADNVNLLWASFRDIARRLGLPEKDYDGPLMLEGVKGWLRDNSGWLLVLDNADDPSVVEGFFPRPNNGHTLLTTRDSATERIADSIEIESMNDDDGAKFLLLRASIPQPTVDDQRYARDIVKELGGLPLAIEQAGANIAQAHGTTAVRQQRLATYLDIYKAHRAELLRQNKPPDYNYTVATTWHLFLQSSTGKDDQLPIEKAHPAAIDLLCMCAFLAPDAIPEELFVGGGPYLGSELEPLSASSEKMEQVFATLGSFSLIKRDVDQGTKLGIFSVHRLVQAVIQDDMSEYLRRLWAEHATRTVNVVFPSKDVDKNETWPLCERYLPHALVCADQVTAYGIVTPMAVAARAAVNPDDAARLVNEVVQLINQAGNYLRVQSRFADAEALLQQALTIRENVSGPDALETAESIDSLARLYLDRYMYRQAERLYTRALAIREVKLDPKDKIVVNSLNRLGLAYWYLGYREAKDELERTDFYAQAGLLLDRALSISEERLGPEDQLTLNIRNNRALLYRSLHNYALAIEVNQQVLKSREAKVEQARNDNKPTKTWEQEVAQSQQNLAVTYYQEQQDALHKEAEKYVEAEDLLKKALEFRLRQYAHQPYHFQIARCQRYLAQVHMAQDKDEEAKAEFEQALDIWDKSSENPAEVMEAREEYLALLRKMRLDEEANWIQKEIERLRNQHPQE